MKNFSLLIFILCVVMVFESIAEWMIKRKILTVTTGGTILLIALLVILMNSGCSPFTF